MNPGAPILRVRELCVRFGDRRAVDGVELDVSAGQLVAIVGESGSGKSVTALSILRLLPPDATLERGRITLDVLDAKPRDLAQLDHASLRRIRGGVIGMIFQEPMTSLNPVFTVAEQITEAVRLHARVTAKEARARAVQTLLDVGVADPASRVDEYPHEWSGGMRQRAMIAMALACKPRLLIADEPTTAIDATVQARLLDLLQQQCSARQLAVLLISHDLGLVAQRADHVYVMLAGRIVESAPARDLFARPMHPYTRSLLASRPSVRRRALRLGPAPVAEIDLDVALPGGGGARAWWPRRSDREALDVGASSDLREIARSHFVRTVTSSASNSAP